MHRPDLQFSAPGDTPLTTLQRYTPVIVLLWFVGVSLMTARLVSSCWATRRLRRVGISPLPEASRARVRQLADDLGLRRGVNVEALAAAVTDGPLLARVRRLVAPASAPSARIALPNVVATLALMFLTVTARATAEDDMHGDNLPGVLLEDVHVPTAQDLSHAEMPPGKWSGTSVNGNGPFSTIVDSYVAALQAGGDEWSAAHVAATFGYPFHFVLKEGAVPHDHNCNIETWQFFDRMGDLGWETTGFSEFTGAGNEPDEEALGAAREQAWEAVTAGIDRGMPAIAWSPGADHDFAGWGLLVGYDRDSKSYHVSHVQTDSIYAIPYDAFGRAWFNVIVFTQRTGANPRASQIATLRRAVEFSKGLRYTVEESQNCCGVDAIGFDAYRLWLDVLESGQFDPAAARSHAWQLMHTRRLAAEYTREAARRLDGTAGARLQVASDHYVQASALARQLLDTVTPWTTMSRTPAATEEARRLLDLVYQWERGAVMYLEVALLNLGEEIPGEPTNPGVATLQGEPPAKVGVDVAPTVPHRGTTLAATLEPVLQTLGRTGWTTARIQGVLGHAFQFQMAEGGGDVWHDNLDWSLGLEMMGEIADARSFKATKESSADERATAMREARAAVRESLNRGVPALVWNPKTVEQKEAGHPGHHGVCWGLIVGYNEAQETYTIRHPFVWQGDYTIGYDEIGDAGATEWLNVMVFDDAKSADDEDLHRMALRNALSFADGTRQGEHRWTQGCTAYETWLAAFESDDVPDIAHHHANILEWRRELAAEYMRDLAEILDDAAEPLAAAAAHYEGEHAALAQLSVLTDEVRSRGYSEADRAEGARLLREALKAERAAVQQIRSALRALGEEVPNAAPAGIVQKSEMNVQVDVAPTKPNAGTTLASTLNALLGAVGHEEWTMARLQGVMGHAFQFQMAPDASGHMHDNLDWSIALEAIPQIGRFRSFEASKDDTDIDLWAYKAEARDAARQSLDRGMPVLVWQPMSREQQADKTNPAHHAYCWGLVVGYNEAEEEYTIRHPFVPETYTVRYDSIGHSDGHEWFHLKMWEGESPEDAEEIHRSALRHAVEFANGTRFTDENFVMADGRQARPYGFAAYETWRDAFDSPEIGVHHSAHHTRMLQYRREAAAAYMRELVGIFPDAKAPLETAAAHYDNELQSVQPLFELCDTVARGKRQPTDEERSDAQRLIGAALAADRAAVGQIELALTQLDAPQEQ